MEFIVLYQWSIFIAAEVLSVIALLLFGFFRYFLNKRKVSMLFIFTFLVILAFEAILAFIFYQQTGEVSSFQIVIGIFVLYACTFGFYDFLKMDRWMRQKFSKWRGVDLLTEEDYRTLQRQKDPKYVAKMYRTSATLHLVVFVTVQSIFWIYGTANFAEIMHYLSDRSWIEVGIAELSPYPNEATYSIGMIWAIVFVVDFIYSWSYTFFPDKK
ncbi:hypothetical protein [Alkalibacillus aidingensis]|uniref:hypothetical protein n=1 Tax=Alkalibacillus aidingensis TaxID=2747607 RepID=UPI001660102E|nr:hypothetical protein [Alkalibacillus aidingensis]